MEIGMLHFLSGIIGHCTEGKISLYLEKQKLLFLKCQYQNKKALFTNPIFSEGFVSEEEFHQVKEGY
jgi:hypothetical protein